MDVVLFAGGFGTRLAEETQIVPKPMVEIGGIPILVHIMRHYYKYGLRSFIICGGYKVDYIKNYFKNYLQNVSDIQLDFTNGDITYFNKKELSWRVKIIDTGLNTMTAGRLMRVQNYIESDNFCLTYGDGLSDINLDLLIDAHNSNGCNVTLSAVVPPARFGALKLHNNKVVEFEEKPEASTSRVNGGFMVVNKSIMFHISSDAQSFEADILPRLAANGDVGYYSHDGFWQPMDTLRDKNRLQELWDAGSAPWMI